METRDSELTKRREVLFQEPHPDPDQAGSAARLLLEVEGVIEADAPHPTRLVVTYHLLHLSLREIEAALHEVGFHLDNSLICKVRRALWYYAEDTQRANAGCDDPRNCIRRLFVDQYQQRQHGCRDERPEHWREYW